MFRASLLASVAVALTAPCLSTATHAGPILAAAGVSTNMGTQSGTIGNVTDQSGLAPGYTSGVTDFASYTASATATGGNGNVWISGSGIATGVVNFALGGSYTIDSFALWTLASDSATSSIQDFTLLASTNSSFQNATTLGTFTAAQPNSTAPSAQDFDFNATTASYVRLEITSNYGASNTGFNEAAFDEAVNTPVPEPSSLTILGGASLIVGACSWQRRKRSKLMGLPLGIAASLRAQEEKPVVRAGAGSPRCCAPRDDRFIHGVGRLPALTRSDRGTRALLESE